MIIIIFEFASLRTSNCNGTIMQQLYNIIDHLETLCIRKIFCLSKWL